jgi:hypothetical protein
MEGRKAETMERSEVTLWPATLTLADRVGWMVPYRLDQDWIGTVEMAFCGEPSITRSL